MKVWKLRETIGSNGTFLSYVSMVGQAFLYYLGVTLETLEKTGLNKSSSYILPFVKAVFILLSLQWS